MALEKIHKKYGKDRCYIKLVKQWEDAGEPEALYRTLSSYKNGEFLTNFDPKTKKIIQSSMKEIYDGKTLLVSHKAVDTYGSASSYTTDPIPKNRHQNKNVDGVNVIV